MHEMLNSKMPSFGELEFFKCVSTAGIHFKNKLEMLTFGEIEIQRTLKPRVIFTTLYFIGNLLCGPMCWSVCS